jgi:UPF0271 protein
LYSLVTMPIDLNCDMGELTTPEHEAALMQYITSANMPVAATRGMNTPWSARRAWLWIAACASAPTRIRPRQFRRMEIPMTGEEIELAGVPAGSSGWMRWCGGAGGRIIHVKPHGALYNVAVRNADVARAIANGAARWNRSAILFGLAGSAMLEVWSGMGMTVAGEAFADRRYEPDGTLRSRKLADALITDAREAAAQALRFAREGKAQTICVHGDTPGSVGILRACREALT